MHRLLLAACAVLLAVGCAAPLPDEPPDGARSDSPDSPSSESTPAESASQDGRDGRFRVVDDAASDLDAPWAMAALPDGAVLLTHRDSAEVSRVGNNGRVRAVGRIDGVLPGGEGGLLGIAVAPGEPAEDVYVYYTAQTDNRVARLTWDGDTLKGQRVVLSGIPKSQIHNGGRLAFGPDRLLYVATGDAGDGRLAQDRSSLGGKILRVTASGQPAEENPDPSSPVFSWGHRNVQGLAWDDDGRLWASEFGASDADELNLIEAGGNYGWPQCEGRCDRDGFIDPEVVWSPTSIASPSGMTIAADSAWIASLRGATLWQVPLSGGSAGEPIARLEGEFGRLRDAILGPDGRLWVATNNTDGRGSPRSGDDRILRIQLPGNA